MTLAPNPGPARQFAIYRDGVAGRRPRVLLHTTSSGGGCNAAMRAMIRSLAIW